MRCPAEVYSASPRPYAGLPDLDLSACTTAMSWSPPAGASACTGRSINISTVLAGQRLGIKEVDEGIWLVSFMHYDLGYIDLEQRTLQPLDNPFGPRLSPMS